MTITKSQLNIRIPDDVRATAEAVLRGHNLTLSAYLMSVTQNIAESGTLPVIFRLHIIALNPDEILTEAFFRFRSAYTHVHGLYETRCENVPLPEKGYITRLVSEVNAAGDFFERNRDTICAAPAQMDVQTAYGDGVISLARSQEIFPGLHQALLRAVIKSGSTDEMEAALMQAVSQLELLQEMISRNVSTEALTMFLVQDVKDILDSAGEAIRPGLDLRAAAAFLKRMKDAAHRADQSFFRMGISDHTRATEHIMQQVRQIIACVGEYLDAYPHHQGVFDRQGIDHLKSLIFRVRIRAYPNRILFQTMKPQERCSIAS